MVIVVKNLVPLCLKVCKLGCGSIEAPSRGEPKPGPLGPDFYFSDILNHQAFHDKFSVEVMEIYNEIKEGKQVLSTVVMKVLI